MIAELQLSLQTRTGRRNDKSAREDETAQSVDSYACRAIEA